jgi:hypothetical protein
MNKQGVQFTAHVYRRKRMQSVLLGHSTGCQDIVTLLRGAPDFPGLAGVVLQVRSGLMIAVCGDLMWFRAAASGEVLVCECGAP